MTTKRRPLQAHASMVEYVPELDATFYSLVVSYHTIQWEVKKHYREFVQLHSDLLFAGYCALPVLPITFKKGSLLDLDALNEQKTLLDVFLQKLLKRPDLSTSATMMEFFCSDEHLTETMDILQPELLDTTGENRFAISNFIILEERKLILVGYEDNTELSRFGKLWTLVEPEEMGALYVWRIEEDADIPLDCLLKMKLFHRVRGMHFDEHQQHLIMGQEDGKLAVYTFSFSPLALQLLCEIDAHVEAISSFIVSSSYLLSVSVDASMRLTNLSSLEIHSGGRLNKRLENQGFLTACELDWIHHTAFIGTSRGDLFIYDIQLSSPIFCQRIQVAVEAAISLLLRHGTYLFVAVEEAIFCYKLDFKDKVLKMHVITRCVCESQVNCKVLSLFYHTEKKLLFAGYEGGILVWCLVDGSLLCGWDAHEGAGVSAIRLLLDDRTLLTGGDNGELKIWKLQLQAYLRWSQSKSKPLPSSSSTVTPTALPPTLIKEEASSSIPSYPFLPSFSSFKAETPKIAFELSEGKDLAIFSSEIPPEASNHAISSLYEEKSTMMKNSSLLQPITHHHLTANSDVVKDFKNALDGL
ncbi:WD domain, G-beta repeat-containing protein [Cardiosporidium cionae]|uniref:WD domain, G-beta repeat-containing protein n=1 Tax=Cardiosporidium cionae TaxID=476202 RepID=A0ABQ7J7N5_9APIC|nr:WD domain, G-beta repeat-containing protein [Cardiosporidium cionae]|eukprot:KAF8820003.1 WD domain, G-beta repeat-containing protein [Cardiosporidium cionae]